MKKVCCPETNTKVSVLIKGGWNKENKVSVAIC